ncbi:MAG TPA: hydrogenase [Vicinamibacteria bacterium]|nr:hydrogenase [Vicinamibacteria bacterium]
MVSKDTNRTLMRWGFFLLLCALVTGLAVPGFTNPRMAVSAHLEGVMNGLLLVIVGLVWSHLGLSGRLAKIVFWLFAYAAFANWGVTTLAAALGTSRLTPMAGAGYSASPMQENVVQVIQVSLALAVIAAVALVVYSLRRGNEPA